MSDDLVFRATNCHIEACDKPPAIDQKSGSGRFCSYFEYAHGEQWVFEYDRETDRISVFGGDCGWERESTVTSLSASLEGIPKAPGFELFVEETLDKANTLGMTSAQVVSGPKWSIPLGNAEKMWIDACMEVVKSLSRLSKAN